MSTEPFALVPRIGLSARAHEEEDEEPDDEGDDERRPLRDGDREHPEIQDQEEHDRPEEALDAAIDARHAQVHRGHRRRIDSGCSHPTGRLTHARRRPLVRHRRKGKRPVKGQSVQCRHAAVTHK